MPRTRRHLKRNSPIIEANEDQPKKKRISIVSKAKATDESSSESDIENYLKPASEIDLNSTFFKTTVQKTNFEDIEKDIFSGINCLSDSESNDDLEQSEEFQGTDHISVLSGIEPSSSKSVINFGHIHAYNQKLEEAKKQIEAYKAKKETEEKNVDVLNLLTLGESKSDDTNIHSLSVHSSEYETVSDSEKEDWEEVGTVEENTLIPKKGLQITVELQGNVRKKKGVDLMDVIKRRLNKIKKDNQVLIHKVHLLCWIAHGNYINNVLSSQNLMSLALSLLPSQASYPPQRLSLSYIEDILQWYRKSIKLRERQIDVLNTMEDLLQQQITKMECYNYKMFVYIFVCILRSLGIRCRLVLSLQVEPLRPSSSELCSLSKTTPKTTKAKDKKSANTSVLHNRVKTPARTSKKKEISTVVSARKHIEKKVSAKPRESETFKKVNVEDMRLSLIENETALNKEDKQTNKCSTSGSSNKNKKGIEKSFNAQGVSSSSSQYSKAPSDKKGTHKSVKENKSVPSQKSNSKTAVAKQKEIDNNERYTRNQGESSKNDNLNLRKSTRQKKVVTSQNEIKNSDNNLISSNLEDISILSHKAENVTLKQSYKQAKNSTKQNSNITTKRSLNLKKINETSKKQVTECVKEPENHDISSSIKLITCNTRNSSNNLREVCAENTGTVLKSKEKPISNKRDRKSVSPKEAVKDSVKSSSCEKNPAKNLENNDKLTVDKQRKKSVSPKESDVREHEQKLKIKMPFKLKSTSKNSQKSVIKQRIDCIPSVVIDQENKTETTQQVIPQLDGGNDTDDSDVESSKIKVKPNLQKLKSKPTKQCLTKVHPQRLRKAVQYKEINSDEDFHPRDSSTSKNSDSPNNKTNIKPNSKNISQKMSSKILKTHREKLNSQTSSDSDRSKYFGASMSGKLDVRNDIINLVKQNLSAQKQMLRSKLVKHKRSSKSYSSASDSDYFPEPAKKKALQDDFKEKHVKVKRRIPMKKDLIEMEKQRQSDKEEQKKNKGVNIWVEVFAEAEGKWISVDAVKGQVHCVKEIYTRATHPISYILSWDNENNIKDITKRYCLNWNTVTRKLRVDPKWWDATLLPYKAPDNFRDREENEDLAKQQLEQPLPTTISEYKDHPLYALKRHLLKFEALYPPDALILGFIRNEPVYSRDCVHVLHSREIWLKHAKVVKLGETPYKIVKARPKYDKLSNSVITDKPLEIFGKWQVEDYVPPTAENGIVPRNAYGNVELFKSCMLPKGTVHLQLPGLNKVAKKMNIDCAPAVIGFDFHGGWSHPTFDGFVVCEEYSEQIIAAWYSEQEESERKAQEKIEKRVYDNWRRLIKGLLIRERLKARYDFGEVSSKGSKTKKKGLILKKRQIQSDSDSE